MRTYYPRAGVTNLWDLMPDDLRRNRCNNNRNKVHNKCTALNYPVPSSACLWKNCLPQNWSLRQEIWGDRCPREQIKRREVYEWVWRKMRNKLHTCDKISIAVKFRSLLLLSIKTWVSNWTTTNSWSLFKLVFQYELLKQSRLE